MDLLTHGQGASIDVHNHFSILGSQIPRPNEMPFKKKEF